MVLFTFIDFIAQIFLSDQLSWTSYKDGSVLPAAFSMLEKIQENLLNGKCTFLQTEVSTG